MTVVNRILKQTHEDRYRLDRYQPLDCVDESERIRTLKNAQLDLQEQALVLRECYEGLIDASRERDMPIEAFNQFVEILQNRSKEIIEDLRFLGSLTVKYHQNAIYKDVINTLSFLSKNMAIYPTQIQDVNQSYSLIEDMYRHQTLKELLTKRVSRYDKSERIFLGTCAVLGHIPSHMKPYFRKIENKMYSTARAVELYYEDTETITDPIDKKAEILQNYIKDAAIDILGQEVSSPEELREDLRSLNSQSSIKVDTMIKRDTALKVIKELSEPDTKFAETVERAKEIVETNDERVEDIKARCIVDGNAIGYSYASRSTLEKMRINREIGGSPQHIEDTLADSLKSLRSYIISHLILGGAGTFVITKVFTNLVNRFVGTDSWQQILAGIVIGSAALIGYRYSIGAIYSSISSTTELKDLSDGYEQAKIRNNH